MIYQLLILIESEMILNFFNDIQYYKEKKILSIVKSVIDLIVVFLILVAIFIYQVMILWITEKELDNNMHTLFLEQNPADICISSITYAELTYGVEKSSAVEKNGLHYHCFFHPLRFCHMVKMRLMNMER